MHIEKLTNRTNGHGVPRFWRLVLVAYVVIVTLLLALGGHAGVPSPTDIGWTA